jgi:hypothetical protein
MATPYTPDWLTSLILGDTTTNPGTVVLPSASTLYGRTITIKDPSYKYGINPLTVCTITDSDQFEDGTSTIILNTNGAYITLTAGSNAQGIPTWYTINGTQVCTIQTQILGLIDNTKRGLPNQYSQITIENGYLLADGNFISTNYQQGFPNYLSSTELYTSSVTASTLSFSDTFSISSIATQSISTILNPTFSTFQLFDIGSNIYQTISLSSQVLFAGNYPVVTGTVVTVPETFNTCNLYVSSLTTNSLNAPYSFQIQNIGFPSATAFSPSSIPNMVGWFDASDSTYITQNFGNVNYWKDKSPAQSNLRQLTQFNCPQVQSNSIYFNGHSYLYNTASIYNVASNMSMMIVGEATNSVSGYEPGILSVYKIGETDTSSSNSFAFKSIFTSNIWHNAMISQFAFPNGAVGSLYTSSNASVKKNIYEFIVSPSLTTDAFITGTQYASNISSVGIGASFPGSPDGLLVGTSYTGAYDSPTLYGNIYEVVYYNQQITQEQRELLEGYLAWKWSLQTNLPPRHPYRWVKPT